MSAGKAWLCVILAGCAFLALIATAPSIPFLQSPPVDTRPLSAHTQPLSHYTLRILASSDLRNMRGILAQATVRTGVTVRLTTADSAVAAAQEVAEGTAQRRYDAVWFASDDYFGLFPPAVHDLTRTTPVMSSPVALAVRSSAARRLGWENGHVTWKDIEEAAAARRFTFGMASPVTSAAGLSGLVAAATATARSDGPLRQDQILGTVPELTELFHSQLMSAPDSGDLARLYLKELARSEPGLPEGIVDDEADLIALKAEAPRDDPLTLIYPSDGVVEADYPLSLLTTAPPAARSAFERLVGYLTSRSVQRQIMTGTHRRPVVRLRRPDGGLPAGLDVLRSPGNPATIRRLIDLYIGQLRAPGRTVYVLDTSGSMKGAGLNGLKGALSALTGAGAGTAAKFSDFRDGEEVTFLPFSDQPGMPETFTIPRRDAGPTLAGIRRYVKTLQAGGFTSIYDSLVRAYKLLKKEDRKAPRHIDSIVLITDGMNNRGRGLDGKQGFVAYYNSLWAHSEPAPVYAIAVGKASRGPLQRLANLTGGTLAKHEPPGALAAIIDYIRGYQ